MKEKLKWIQTAFTAKTVQVHLTTMSSSIFLNLTLKSDVTRTVPAYHISRVREIESAAPLTAIILKDIEKKNHSIKKIQVQLDHID